MGLMTRVFLSASKASFSEDQANHAASFVRTSRITLLSTRTSNSTPSEGHDLVRRHPDRTLAAHALDKLFTAATWFAFQHTHVVLFQGELYLHPWQQAGLVPDFLWNCHLT